MTPGCNVPWREPSGKGVSRSVPPGLGTLSSAAGGLPRRVGLRAEPPVKQGGTDQEQYGRRDHQQRALVLGRRIGARDAVGSDRGRGAPCPATGRSLIGPARRGLGRAPRRGDQVLMIELGVEPRCGARRRGTDASRSTASSSDAPSSLRPNEGSGSLPGSPGSRRRAWSSTIGPWLRHAPACHCMALRLVPASRDVGRAEDLAAG